MKKIAFLFVMVLSINLMAQQAKINFALRAAINKAQPNEKISVFVRGNVSQIKEALTNIGGISKLSMTNIVQAHIPANQLESFSKNKFVEYIEYSIGKGQVLNDTMLVHNNILPIHNGLAPLHENYTGKNVMMGIIDTGIDIDHPDFQDTTGNTRILKIWDQYNADDGSSGYGYGQVWDSTEINGGTCTHLDHNGINHGVHVSGIAAGNGLAVGDYTGVAPESNIISVASNQGVANWLGTVVDAVKFIYDEADNYGMPCSINVSMGDYFGSHDGTDAAALLIDSLVNYKPGRALVAAAGNAGSIKLHLEHQVDADTSFTWFKYNASSGLGYGAVFYELWSDTTDFNNVDFAIGANLPSGTYEQRGKTGFYNIQNILGSHSDTILNGSGDTLGIVDFYSELQGDKYLVQIHMQEPDSNQLLFSLMTTGSGRLDIWTTHLLGTSTMVESPLPDTTVLPAIAHYVLPDVSKTMVSSFQHSESTLAVANFVNRAMYVDVDTIVRYTGKVPGEKAASSSWGPGRRGALKPDIGATGDYTIGPVSAPVVAANMVAPSNRMKIALGGMHRYNGGTSMASPVIAGVAALYLQKCPTATMTEIKNAITSTAVQDTFTGPVPNFGFGYGKVNAFDALNTSNYMVSLGADEEVCDGDSVEITTGSYQSYLWSNSDTSSSVYIDTTETVFVEVTNSSGCKAWSDSVDVTWHALPIKPIINVVGNDTLIYSTDLDLQWYYNSSSIGGETDTFLIAQSNGDYFVQVTDSFSCSNYSDTVNVILLSIDNQLNEPGISYYPNPAKGNFIINKNKESKVNRIKIIDIQGKELYNQLINKQGATHVNLNLPNGIYYIKFISDDDFYLEKLILAR